MEVTPITRQNYLGELKKLLAGMSNADREATLARYDAMFEDSDSDEDVISRLGSPTFVALGELRGYVRPDEEEIPEEPYEPSANVGPDPLESSRRLKSLTPEDVAAARAAMNERTAAVAAPEVNIPKYSPPEDEPRPELSKGKLALYILCAVIFGIPLTIVLVLVALAILALGAALIAAGCFIISLGFLGMDIFVDLMLLFGAGLIVAALGLPIAFLAVWFFIRGVVGFVNWIILSGERWCEKKPIDREADEDIIFDGDEPVADFDLPPELAEEVFDEAEYLPPELPEEDGGYELEEPYLPQDGAPDDVEEYIEDEEEPEQ